MIGHTAGSRLAYSAVLLSGEWFGTQFFDQVTSLAITPYEGRVGQGEIVIARPNHPDVGVLLRFLQPLKMGASRAIRKVLEMSDPGFSLLTDGKSIFGMGRVQHAADEQTEDLFKVRVTGTGIWELYAGPKPLLRVEHGHAQIPHSRLRRDAFEDTVRRRLSTVSEAGLDTLWRLALEATRQIHGAMLIVSADASGEASRMRPQVLALEPRLLDEPLIRAATAIDGGVLLDPSGTCHAIGVILDGVADGVGDSARGSRYNSAVRYLRSDPPGCVILIVSEDGMIDILPKLRPRISRRDLAVALDEVESAARSNDEDPERFAKAWSRIESLAFYLNYEECLRANAASRAVDEARARTGSIRIIQNPLVPHPEMDESHFSD